MSQKSSNMSHQLPRSKKLLILTSVTLFVLKASLNSSRRTNLVLLMNLDHYGLLRKEMNLLIPWARLTKSINNSINFDISNHILNQVHKKLIRGLQMFLYHFSHRFQKKSWTSSRRWFIHLRSLLKLPSLLDLWLWILNRLD